MDLEEAKEFWERKPIFHDEYGIREVTEFLYAEVERLEAERNEFKESYRLAMVSVNHAYDKGKHKGRMEALNAVFAINGPSRAIAQLKEKYEAEAVCS